jgi:hypothetical protein
MFVDMFVEVDTSMINNEFIIIIIKIMINRSDLFD